MLLLRGRRPLISETLKFLLDFFNRRNDADNEEKIYTVQYNLNIINHMSLKINNLKKDGDTSKEYILLEATEEVNINNYAIVDRTFDKDGKASNINKHFYRFPSQIIKKGEYVSLRTGKGINKKVNIDKLGIVHRFYWGSDAPFWNDNQIEKAELLTVKTIETAIV